MEPLTGSLVLEMLELTNPQPVQLLKPKAQLLFLDGQTLLLWEEDDKQHSKLVSPVALRTAFSQEPIDSGWIEPGVVRCGSIPRGDWAVLFIPPQRYDLILNDETVNVPLPALVFMGIGKQYYLWAIPGSTFDHKAKTLKAPLPNVHDDGAMCYGGKSVPEANARSIKEAWKLFITAPFTTEFVAGKSVSYPNSVINKLKASKRKYPVRDLIPARSWGNKTISETVESLIKTD